MNHSTLAEPESAHEIHERVLITNPEAPFETQDDFDREAGIPPVMQQPVSKSREHAGPELMTPIAKMQSIDEQIAELQRAKEEERKLALFSAEKKLATVIGELVTLSALPEMLAKHGFYPNPGIAPSAPEVPVAGKANIKHVEPETIYAPPRAVKRGGRQPKSTVGVSTTSPKPVKGGRGITVADRLKAVLSVDQEMHIDDIIRKLSAGGWHGSENTIRGTINQKAQQKYFVKGGTSAWRLATEAEIANWRPANKSKKSK